MPRYLVELNNYLQKQGQSSALGWTESQTGAGNNILWTMTCKLNGEVMGSATAHQKGAAKEEAARQTLVTLGLLAEGGSAQ
ncbi:hypothetical protein BN946_scf185007.g210 [Trametes cinnabarina]|uniref:DRBM domain-containing protein n=1 Tax=Pycnoporus cinnabarinus TaxID=5643 RepID=A0A060SFK2_PYCCI|nr:hypothetical protein BN946_scf185007.g210 [Trametes cinnabarina]